MKPSLGAIDKYIVRSSKERGAGPYRTPFMRDRDRILYSKPFRRLSKKTQIFLPTSDDHIRTRLTHTLEVAQIATTTATALSLNRDLTEAIALGHDLGHTPFGHSGERTLNLIMSHCDNLEGLSVGIEEAEKGFKHNFQGIRVATELTSLYEGLKGLNLSNFALWGIKNHTGEIWRHCEYTSKDAHGNIYCNIRPDIKGKKCENLGKELKFYQKYRPYWLQEDSPKPAWSFEAYLVKLSDEIAQRHHDIEDGLIANVIDKGELISILESNLMPFLGTEEKRFFKETKSSKGVPFTQRLSRIIVGCLNGNLIENSLNNLKRFAEFHGMKRRSDFIEIYPELLPTDEISDALKIENIISYPVELQRADQNLHEYLKNRVLNCYQVQRMDGKASFLLKELATAYLTNPQQLPDGCVERFFLQMCPYENVSQGDMRHWLSKKYYSHEKDANQHLLRIICDLLAGMTDEFALIEHQHLYSSSENINFRH